MTHQERLPNSPRTSTSVVLSRESDPRNYGVFNPIVTVPLICMQDWEDEMWRWSTAFAEVVKGLIREPLNEWALREDWPKQRQRLVWWLRQVEVARELYGRGHAEALRVLYDYWRMLAPNDPREQARFARETYREFRLSHSVLSPFDDAAGANAPASYIADERDIEHG